MIVVLQIKHGNKAPQWHPIFIVSKLRQRNKNIKSTLAKEFFGQKRSKFKQNLNDSTRDHISRTTCHLLPVLKKTIHISIVLTFYSSFFLFYFTPFSNLQLCIVFYLSILYTIYISNKNFQCTFPYFSDVFFFNLGPYFTSKCFLKETTSFRWCAIFLQQIQSHWHT